jgi:alkaline phosphatase D
MSALRPPGLGPVIGHTTDTSCRLWIQAGDPEAKVGNLSSNRRTVGVLGVLTKDAAAPKGWRVDKGYYFRLQREFDRTGTFVLGKDVALGQHKMDEDAARGLGLPFKLDTPYVLKADSAYCVRMATLAIDDPAPDDESITDVELVRRLPAIENIAPMLLDLRPEECEVVIRTFPAAGQAQKQLAFLLGSCRYPGLLWKIKEADQIFGPMAEHFRKADGSPDARFTLMVGDQIYADTLNRMIPIGLADTYEEFQERYRTAFKSANMRRLLKTAPSYMILDDHEIEDNWTQDRLSDPGTHRLFNFAIGAYMSYQWSHGPRTWGRLLYYRFECGGYPFFVLDTRTQRFKDDEAGLADNHLLGRPAIDPAHPGQLRRLLDWLTEQQAGRKNAPKFIASASVFAPNAMDERLADPKQPKPDLLSANLKRREGSDSWPAYPLTRKAIIDHIVQGGIQNVVFLTGDIHCSNIARLAFTKDDGSDLGLFAYDITSSAFYWPFPFADGDPNNYVHDSKVPGQRDGFPFDGGEMNYTAWAFTQEDNFCRIEIDQDGACLRIAYYDRKGKQIAVADADGKKAVQNTVPLAPW